MNDDQLEHVDYSLFWANKKRWIATLIGVFLLSFLLYFPLVNILSRTVISKLEQIPNCPVYVQNMDVEYFLPKVILKNIKVDNACLNVVTDIAIDKVVLNFRGPSFSPLGLSFKVDLNIFNNQLEVYLGIGMSSLSVNIRDNKINLDNIEIENFPVKISGDILANIYATSDFYTLDELKLKITSTNLNLPAQNIMNFNLSPIDLAPIVFSASKAEGKKRLAITKLDIGQVGSTIRGRFGGHIDLVQEDILLSPINIPGEFLLSDEFLEQNAILKMFLGGYTKKDDFYQIKVSGTLEMPQLLGN